MNTPTHCGHPAACISQAAEGTAYCAWCEDVARAQAERDTDTDPINAAFVAGAGAHSNDLERAIFSPPVRSECPYPRDDTRRRWWLRGYSHETWLRRAMVAEIERNEVSADLTVLAFSVRDALARGKTPATRIARRDLADAVLAVVVERDEALTAAERLRQAIRAHVAESNAVHEQVVRERDAAQDRLVQADLIIAHLLLRRRGSGGGAEIEDGIDQWIDDSRPHIAAAVARRESPERGEEE